MIESSKTVEIKTSTGTFSQLSRRFEDGVFDRAELDMTDPGKLEPTDVKIEVLTFLQAKELYAQLETICCSFEVKEKQGK